MQYAVDGLVISEIKSGENDKRITLLTADKGKIVVSAKGARSLKSKYMNSIELFTYGNYEITERAGFSWLGGASIIEPFYKIRDDIDKLALASYIVDVACELSGAEEPAAELLRLTLNALYAIANNIKSYSQIKAAYELRSMALSGYLPLLDECAICGDEQPALVYLDVMNGVLKCEKCVHKMNLANNVFDLQNESSIILVPMSYNALSLARYITEAPIERVMSFVTDEGTLAMLAKLSETYLVHHLEKNFTSLDFYNSVKKLDAKGH